MKTLVRIFLLSFTLLYDFSAFAQPGDDDNGNSNGGLEGSDTPVPINAHLVLLAIMGVIFVIYTFRKNKRSV